MHRAAWDVFYLRADPAIVCYDDEWNNMAALATLGIIVTCVIAPMVLVLQTSRKHASVERVARARVALLTNTYKDGFHYWEAVRCCATCFASQTTPMQLMDSVRDVCRSTSRES